MRLASQDFSSRFKSLLRYDANTLRETLKANFNAQEAKIYIPDSQPISFSNANIVRDNSTFTGSLYSNDIQDIIIDTICSLDDAASTINDLTGLRVKVENKEEAFKPKAELPTISPSNWGNLSPETINYMHSNLLFLETNYPNYLGKLLEVLLLV